MTLTPEPAYVLHHKPYGETSLIVDAWCMYTGRHSLLVKGARNKQGRRGYKCALLQPFQPLLLSVVGKHSMRYAKTLESSGSPVPLKGIACYCGLYLNELVLRLLALADPHPELFAYYQIALENLSQKNNVQPILRKFEHQLLTELGYTVDLNKTMDTQETVQAHRWYAYIPLTGLYACTTDKPMSAHGKPSGRVEPLYIAGSQLLALTRTGNQDVQIQALHKTIARANIDALLDGKPLRSREIFKQLQALPQ